MSNIIPLNLDENPAAGRGRYSSVSVLEPVMRIERTGDIESDSNPPSGGSEASYRIVVGFVFEVAISGFDQGFQKYNRFFDSVSLRYLFRHGEEVDLRPQSDSAQHDIKVTSTRDRLNGIDAGVSAGMVTAVVPTLSVQAQRDFKLTYQRSMSSWRMGLSFESYPPRDQPLQSWTSKLAARLVDEQPAQEQQSYFQVLSPHKTDCYCRCQPRHRHGGCPLEWRRGRWDSGGHHGHHGRHGHHSQRHRPDHHSRASYHDRAAHWFWQTEASLRLWTPEIYSSFRCPITVMREVPVAEVERLRRIDDLRPLLHFDFEVDTRLRVLGCNNIVNFLRFSKGIKPAELRAQSDTGRQLPSDHVRFCIACCPENISWPCHPTRNLQAEAEEEAVGPGPGPRRLQTNAEFHASLRDRQEEQERLDREGRGQSDEKEESGENGVDEPSGLRRGRLPREQRGRDDASQDDDRSVTSPTTSASPSRESRSRRSTRRSDLPQPLRSFLSSQRTVLWPDRIPPPLLADVEISPMCTQRRFVPGQGLYSSPTRKRGPVSVSGVRGGRNEMHKYYYAPKPEWERGRSRVPASVPAPVVLDYSRIERARPAAAPVRGRRGGVEVRLVQEGRRRNSMDGRVGQAPSERRRVRFQSQERPLWRGV